MLLLAAAGLALPAVLALVRGVGLPSPGAERVTFGGDIEHLSLAIAIVLIVAYGLGLVFSLRTHRGLFNPPAEPERDGGEGGEPWSFGASVAALAIAGVAVGGMSEILVHSVSEAARAAGLTEFFIGAIVVAIVGNAAEHWVAVLVARKDQMDLAVNIAIGSSAQVALFVAPVLVITSYFIGPGPLTLVLNGFELAAILIAILIANHVTSEGESTWFEGVLLLAVYAVLTLTFLFA
jgi:Ca2+:H+ antiporter